MVQRILVVLLLVVLVFSGCKKEAFEPVESQSQDLNVTKSYVFDNSPTTKALDDLAKLVAFSMEEGTLEVLSRMKQCAR